MIKNLVFDFGRVLVTYDFDRILNKYFPPNSPGIDEFMHLLFSSGFMDCCDREEIPLLDILHQQQVQRPHLAHYLQAFYDHFDEFITGEMPGMRSLLGTLKERGYRLYGLSNWHSKVYGVMRRYPIFDLLDGRIISCEEKVVKPEPEIYQRLFARYGLNPQECLFADDKVANVEAARAQGMDAVVFVDTEHYATALQQRGIL